MEKGSSQKVLKWVLATVVFGAIGSGVWERLVSPAFDSLVRTFFNGLSYISTSYVDEIYRVASFAPLNLAASNNGSALRLILLLVIWGGVCFMFPKVKLHLIERNFALNKVRNSNILSFIFGLFALTISYYGLYHAIKNSSSLDVAVYSVKSMEIIRPYTGEPNYLKLKSDYLQIKSKNDFLKFNENLIKEAKANSITLDEFKPI